MRRVVITGLGMVTPLGSGVKANWRRLTAGESGAVRIEEFDVSDIACKIACRIPFGAGPKAKRVEVRFPDSLANPYLAFTAMLMAGLDGIQNRIHPGDAMDKNLYDLPPEELKEVPTVCGSLRQALEALDADHDFLLAGDVFDKDQIEGYLEVKWAEVYAFEQSPHPIEFKMYYSG
jgi:glutamine synthetase